MNTKLIPIILIGGFSKRMNQDKAFLKYQGEYWFKIIYNKFKLYFDTIYFSLRKEQFENYQSMLIPFSKNFIFDYNLNVACPLKGIFTSFLYFQPKDDDFFYLYRSNFDFG